MAECHTRTPSIRGHAFEERFDLQHGICAWRLVCPSQRRTTCRDLQIARGVASGQSPEFAAVRITARPTFDLTTASGGQARIVGHERPRSPRSCGTAHDQTESFCDPTHQHGEDVTEAM
jgi:hypothetical protein